MLMIFLSRFYELSLSRPIYAFVKIVCTKNRLEQICTQGGKFSDNIQLLLSNAFNFLSRSYVNFVVGCSLPKISSCIFKAFL